MDTQEEETQESEPKVYTRDDVESFLGDIAKKLVDNESTHVHTMLALNRIFRLPNAQELFDDELKEQARDLWRKVKSTGLKLSDPPLLFDGSENGAQTDNV